MNKLKYNILKKIILLSKEFDSEFYYEIFPDVKKSKFEALEHFILYGRSEVRRPNKYIDLFWYRNEYLNEKYSNLSCFLHYIFIGKKRGYYPNCYYKMIDKDFIKNNRIKPQECNSLKMKQEQIILFAGPLMEHKYNYLIDLQKEMKNYSFIFLNTLSKDSIPTLNEMNDLNIIHVYPIFNINDQSGTYTVNLTQELLNLLMEDKKVQSYANNIQVRDKSFNKNTSLIYAYYAFKYINEILDHLKPVKVILWNKFTAFNSIFDSICKDKKIFTGYWEFGNIPETYCFDLPPYGQMGESKPAVDYIKFRELPVTDSEITQAEEISGDIYKNKKNRHLQPSDSNEELLSEIRRIKSEGKKVVFYAGQNDFDSGLVPYNNTTEKFHSPIFKNTLEVLNYLLENAEANGWHIVFKPHHLIYKYYPIEKFNNKFLSYASYETPLADVIDICDVTSTILSTVAYDALFRNKPVVMFGFTALKGKGCTYEIFEKNKTVKIINKSLRNGYTNEQKINFHKHIARLLKYYLYSNSIQSSLGNNMQKLICQLEK